MKQTARVAINFSTVFEKRVVWFPSNLEASVRNAHNISSFVISQVSMKWSFYFNHFYKMLYYNHDRFIIWFYIIQYIRFIAMITFNNTNLVLDLKQFFDHTTKERTIRQIVFLSSNFLKNLNRPYIFAITCEVETMIPSSWSQKKVIWKHMWIESSSSELWTNG